MNDGDAKEYERIGDQLRRGNAEAAVRELERLLSDKPDDEIGTSMLGSALLRLGQGDRAMNVFRQNAARHPSSYATHGDLGYAAMQSGDSRAAIAYFEKALRLNPEFYQGHCFLSRLYYDEGRLDDARDSFTRSESCDPFLAAFAEIQAAMSASRFAEAEKKARRTLSRQPGYPRAAYALAHLATNVGAHEESAEILRQSIAAYPCDVNTRAALVKSLEEIGHYEEALTEAVAIAELDPASFAPHLIIGRIHGHCGRYEASLAAYDKALRFIADGDDEAGNVHLLRGHIFKTLGRHDDGIAAYRRSIALVGKNGAGWWGLADMKTVAFTDDDIAAMTSVANDDTVRPEQRTQAAFALGKALEDEGRYADSFRWYAKGNDLRTGARYLPEVNREGIDRLIETFTVDLLRLQHSEPLSGPTPIFITGLPRSGSTLIEQVLASHSQIEGTMELVSLPNLVRRMTIDGGRRKIAYPESLKKFSSTELAAYGKAYVDSTNVYRTGKPYFIDKLPTNFDKIGLLHLILPNAIIIDARRHPLDCGLSCYKQHFASGHHFSYRLEHIASYYNDYLRLMDHWHSVLPGKILTVHYEDTVSNLETTVHELLEHCGVSFEDTCLRFFENKRPVRTASSEQVRQPIYDRSIGYWKNYAGNLEPLRRSLGEETLARFSENLSQTES